jgi:hypothetical protein
VPIAILAAAVTGSYAYLLALGLGTPQNDGDPLVYQLARAALWRQEESVSIIGSAIEPRLDGNPIVAELAQVTWLSLGDSDRFVWIGQFAAVGALSLGAFALARRVGIPARGALMSALLVPTLPVVATQAVAAYNDLIVASFVVAACVFVLGRSRGELVSLGLAAALATATKFTAPFVLPVVALLAVAGKPRRSAATSLATLGVGIAVGAAWYVVNLARTGDLDGGLNELGQQKPVRTLSAVAFSLQRLTLDAIELPGGAGWGREAYVVVGALLVAGGIALAARRARTGIAVAVAGVGVALTPSAVFALHGALSSVFAAVWEHRGLPDRATSLRETPVGLDADGVASWYGPVALALVVTVLVVTVMRVARGTMGRSALVLAFAPLLAVSAFAVGVTFDPWRGRFVAAAVVAASALWGIALERRWAGLAVSLTASVTVLLAVAQYEGKPSGLPGLSSAPRSVWTMERWDEQTVLRRFTHRERGERSTIRFVERVVGLDAEIAVSLWGNDFLFPYFGERLDRHVTVVDPTGRVPAESEWIVIAPQSEPRGCPESWQGRFEHVSGWRVLQRIGEDSCPAPGRLEQAGVAPGG